MAAPAESSDAESSDHRPDPTETARSLVAIRFPGAIAAWLSGSVVLGRATATSDLDITVLDETGPAPYRESLLHDGWPVELFVHTHESVRHYIARDLARRRPSMARLIATGVPLRPGDRGESLRAECAAVLAAGPPPMGTAELALERYALTDVLDDLAGGGAPEVVAAAAVAAWRQAAELLLASQGRWRGAGKWLAREVIALDADLGSAWAADLHAGLAAAVAGDPGLLTAVCDRVLDPVGGRLWAGFRAEGSSG